MVKSEAIYIVRSRTGANVRYHIDGFDWVAVVDSSTPMNIIDLRIKRTQDISTVSLCIYNAYMECP